MGGRRIIKTPLKERTQSPAVVLSPNDDNFERAQSRAARAAAVRKTSLFGANNSVGSNSCQSSEDVLNREQIVDLLQNCIRLASENKINQRNTWDLSLIDHLSEIIHVDDDSDTETNFQKASCTLEAGVKIYSLRVDSVYSEAYKVLGGINRTGKGDSVEGNGNDKDAEDDMDQNEADKRQTQMISNPSNTLESSFETLNVKKFDVAFSVDPLYHQTSAQFDEGGAKGFLLNTLSAYNDCLLAFDSSYIPGKSAHSDIPKKQEKQDAFDVSFMKDCIRQMAIGMQITSEISPTLEQIVSLLDDPYRNSSQWTDSMQTESDAGDTSCNYQESYEDDVLGGVDDLSYVEDTCTDSYENTAPAFANADASRDHYNNEDNFVYAENEFDRDMPDEGTVDYLILGMGLSMKAKAWAGPDHWKYKRSKDIPKDSDLKNETSAHEQKPRRKKREPFTIDYSNCQDAENVGGFTPPKSLKPLQLPHIITYPETILPEDCHYQAEELVKLFMIPSILCISKEAKKVSDNTLENGKHYEGSCGWDNNDGFDANWDDEQGFCTDLNGELIVQPRKVQKIDVNYDRTSKQVDVHILKRTLWTSMQAKWSLKDVNDEENSPSELSFQSLLHAIPNDCPAAAPDDISIHLCFICLLHLANEHSLIIKDSASLDDLDIRIPVAAVRE